MQKTMKFQKLFFLAIKFIYHSLIKVSCRMCYLSDSPPFAGRSTRTPQLFGEQVGRCSLHQLFQHLFHDTQRPISSCHIQTESHCLQSWPNAAVVQFTWARYWRNWLLLLQRILALAQIKEHTQGTFMRISPYHYTFIISSNLKDGY